jgi:murein DD-endopeptidase MepM/ murein hydrolase activator NlpD
MATFYWQGGRQQKSRSILLSIIIIFVFTSGQFVPPQEEWIEIELYNVDKEQYWSAPLQNTTLQTSPYGMRNGRMHAGIDLGLRQGESVFAVFDGLVKVSAFDYGYGNYILIEHDNGLETLYAHLEARVKAGAKVKAGQMIARGGNTGWSTGSHLHFEIRYKGRRFNPNYVFDFYNNTQQIKVEKLFLSTKAFAKAKDTDKW